ncbi:MAG: hypothetical protein ACXVCY_08355 [Pseudobdellovibrionaceae bacterium]
MADLEANYRIVLKKYLDRRQSANPRFSQNAFAKFLGIDKTYFSKLMKGKILLSMEFADLISHRLMLNEADRREFIISAAEEQKCHSLHLLDPSLTDCDLALEEVNVEPKPRNKNSYR